MCVCLYCYPIYSGRRTCGRTSRGHTGGRPHRFSHPPSFCGACLNFYREKASAVPFPRRAGSRISCTHELIVLYLLGMFFYFFLCAPFFSHTHHYWHEVGMSNETRYAVSCGTGAVLYKIKNNIGEKFTTLQPMTCGLKARGTIISVGLEFYTT